MTLMKCLGCHRILMACEAKPPVSETDTLWRVEAICGYPRCGDKSQQFLIRGNKIRPQGHFEGEKRKTELATQTTNDDLITFYTRPAK